MKRRKFLQQLGATGLGLSLFNSAQAEKRFFGTTGTASGRVVVVGGGMAGATAAKFLRLWGGSNVQVTLIDTNPSYISNIFSNKVLTGEMTLSSLTYTYSNLVTKYGVTIVNDTVTGLNSNGSTVTVSLNANPSITCERVILATGIEFVNRLTDVSKPDYVPVNGSNSSKIVHAWKAGDQTTNLKTQIQNMTKADTFILTIPKAPYRCPPGPYERACVVADYLKRVKGGGKVVVLDANSAIQAQAANFGYAFDNTFKGVVTYVPNAKITSIDSDAMKVYVDNSADTSKPSSYTAKVINHIPAHRASDLIFTLNMANAGRELRWAGVNELTYESTAMPLVHVIGDSCYTKNQPKAGHIANTEAKVCVAAIINFLSGGTMDTVNKNPVTNSSCFTPITYTTASWLSGVYKYDAASSAMKLVTASAIASNGANSHNYEDMKKWFTNLMADTFN